MSFGVSGNLVLCILSNFDGSKAIIFMIGPECPKILCCYTSFFNLKDSIKKSV